MVISLPQNRFPFLSDGMGSIFKQDKVQSTLRAPMCQWRLVDVIFSW